MKPNHTDAPAPRRMALWVAGPVLAIAITKVGYEARPGLNWFLSIAAIALSLAVLERPSPRALASQRYVAVGVAVGLSSLLAVTADALLQSLLALAIAVLGAVVVRLGAGLAPGELGPAQCLATPWQATRLTASAASRVVGDRLRTVGEGRAIAPLRGTAAAAAIVMVFGGLLAEADPTLAAARDSIVHAVTSLSGIGRVGVCTALAFGLVGFLGVACHCAGNPRAGGAGRASPAVHTDTERLIILGTVAALFAVFLLLQAPYLFENPGARAGSGVTFAAAVHRGFIEITIVASLTAGIVLLLDRRAARGPRETAVRIVGYLVLLECVLLLGSAWLRLDAYEGAYGYTLPRTYVRGYVLALAVTLLMLAAELRAGVDPARFCWRLGMVAVAALAALAIGNPGAWVVRANAERYIASGRMDWDYLAQTGPDGLPTLAHLLPRLTVPEQARVTETLRASGWRPGAPDRWFEWNLHRSMARGARQAITHESP